MEITRDLVWQAVHANPPKFREDILALLNRDGIVKKQHDSVPGKGELFYIAHDVDERILGKGDLEIEGVVRAKYMARQIRLPDGPIDIVVAPSDEPIKEQILAHELEHVITNYEGVEMPLMDNKPPELQKSIMRFHLFAHDVLVGRRLLNKGINTVPDDLLRQKNNIAVVQKLKESGCLNNVIFADQNGSKITIQMNVLLFCELMGLGLWTYQCLGETYAGEITLLARECGSAMADIMGEFILRTDRMSDLSKVENINNLMKSFAGSIYMHAEGGNQ